MPATARSALHLCCAGSATSNRCASFRQPPISTASSCTASIGWYAAIPPFCCATASEAPPPLAGHTVEVRFDPLDASEVEVWFQGQRQSSARPLDPVVNGRLPFTKPAATPGAEPTGINFVELLHDKKDDDEEPPW